MKTFYGWAISLVTVLAIMGCGGGSSPPGSGGGPGEETEAAIVAEATQVAIDLSIIEDCTRITCMHVSSQGDPLLFDQGRVETMTCDWSCIPVQTNEGDERFVKVVITWERFVDRCYGEAEPIVVLAFEIPFLCTPNF